MAGTIAPPTGENPLDQSFYDQLHAQPTTGGSDAAAQQWAFLDFQKQFGRNPTQSELNQLSAGYGIGDKNLLNLSAGKAAVSQYYNSLANTPATQYAQQQKQYEADAPKFYDQINGMFQSTVGRDATDDEKKHFGSLLASGQVDPYTVNQFLTALPENVQKQDATFRDTLNKTLQGQDAQYYNEQILPGIQSQFAKQGRSVDSSAFANSAALAAQQQNRQRESFLSGLTADQYQNSQGLAQSAYNNSYGNYQNLQNYSMQRSNQLQDATTSRLNDIQNYAMQKQAYDQYLSRYGKRSSGQGIGQLAGTALGAGLGAGFAGPGGGVAGAQLGATIGGSTGGGIGSFF